MTFGWGKVILSAFWSTATAGVRTLARLGVLRARKLDCRVIGVGNLQVGGAGKTPLVVEIAREAVQRGLKVCVLTRGYGGLWESLGGVIAPHETDVESALSGDEAALIHERVPEAWIGVGADRAQQFEKITSTLKQTQSRIDLVILDDGFQHWRIHQDLRVLALTSASRSRVLYRDWPGAARGADLVVWTKGVRPPRDYDVRVRYELEPLPGVTSVWLVTGVASPAEVVRSLQEHGVKVVHHLQFPDHARYDVGMVQAILKDARQAGYPLVITGKDWVKWRDLGVSREAVRVIEPQLKFEQGQARWSEILWGNGV